MARQLLSILVRASAYSAALRAWLGCKMLFSRLRERSNGLLLRRLGRQTAKPQRRGDRARFAVSAIDTNNQRIVARSFLLRRTITLSCWCRIGGRRPRGTARAIPVGSNPRFGLPFRSDKPSAQRGLTFPQIGEECADIKIMFRRQLFAVPMYFGDNRVFPHNARLP